MVTTHYAISHATPSLLCDFMLRTIALAERHKGIIYGVYAALRYFLCYSGTHMVLKDHICQGAKLVVSGKIDGADRKKYIPLIIGGIPTSSFSVNIRYDQGFVITRYGSIHVHI
jgi:hypothetical protein